ncbi:MGS-like domain protein [[Clostridium] sordellii ATCC 9714]|nr:MGS-like domain protein [[Clostridium] sordellii ATCC 9714] [Paeniclostridium sordellii ATCC 9714]
MSNKRGVVLATVNNYDKDEFMEIAKDMNELGYTFVATEGTAKALRENGIEAKVVNRVEEARPNILDVIRNKQVDIVINTPTKGNDSTRDGFKIRRTATEFSTEVMTSLDTLKALVEVKKKEINRDGLSVYNIAE